MLLDCSIQSTLIPDLFRDLLRKNSDEIPGQARNEGSEAAMRDVARRGDTASQATILPVRHNKSVTPSGLSYFTEYNGGYAPAYTLSPFQGLSRDDGYRPYRAN